MFVSGSDNINSCGVDTAVTEYVCELGNVLFYAIEGSCEKVVQIMGKHLLRIYPCLHTKIFHFTPNISAAHRLATSGYKDRTGRNLLLCCIAEQFLLQFSNDEYRACFAFKRYNRFTTLDCFDRNYIVGGDSNGTWGSRGSYLCNCNRYIC